MCSSGKGVTLLQRIIIKFYAIDINQRKSREKERQRERERKGRFDNGRRGILEFKFQGTSLELYNNSLGTNKGENVRWERGTQSWRKYYCYHQNSKQFLLPFKNENFSNIAIAIMDFSLLLPIQLSLFQLCDRKSCRS